MQCWGFHSKAQCPRCVHPMEDKEHIFKCPAESAHTQWNKSIAELNQWLQIAWTHLQIRKDIINSLQQWHGQIPGCRPYIEGSTAGLTQDNISWGLAQEGCIAKRWQEEQDMFWKAIKSRKSSQRWTTALLNQLMMMAWDMWNHRNKALHEEKANKQAILEDAHQKIQLAYKQGLELLPTNARSLMKCPLSRLLLFPKNYKCQWIATVEAAKA